MTKQGKSGADRYKGPSKWLQYLFARGLITLVMYLPIGFAFRLGRGVGWLCWKLLKSRRTVVRKNLEIVNRWMGGQEGCPEVGALLKRPIEAQVREVFQRSGANLLAGFPLSRLRPEAMEAHLDLEGLEHLREALASGKGAIILLAHMGPWEVLTQLPGLAARHGIDAPFSALYRPFNNAYLETWYKSQREAKGTTMFSSRYKFYAPSDFVRNGGILGVLSDQKASGGESVSFFGQTTSATPLPGLLHLRVKAPLLALSMETISPVRWCLRFRPVEVNAVDPEKRRAQLAALISRAMEQTLMESVLDGFWFHSRFKKKKKKKTR